jgi:phosphoglucosamine mutase
MTLEGMRIVVDCANGAAYKATPCVLRELGAQVFVYGNQPDGMNINKDCGSMHPKQIREAVYEHHAHMGIAHDGDADRVLLCDENGREIDGDDVLAICGLDMLACGTLAEKTVVATVMSNAGLLKVIADAGGRVVQTAVGDKNVIDEMLRGGYSLGGESSGHLIFRDYSTTGDGLVSALQILRIMKTRDQPLSSLAKCWVKYPQVVANINVRQKTPFDQLDGVWQLVGEAEHELNAAGGRLLLRYSGTEPKARLLLEGPDEKVLQGWSNRITEQIKKHIGVVETPSLNTAFVKR